MEAPRILLLGVGNILYSDEGVGVHAANYLEKHYTFSPNVTLMDGGVLGKLLMPQLLDADRVLIMDAVLGGEKPGSIYRLTDNNLRKSLGFSDSQHQVDLVDILISCDLTGHRPEAVVIGMEPEDWKTLQMEITPVVQENFQRYIDLILRELVIQGGEAFPK